MCIQKNDTPAWPASVANDLSHLVSMVPQRVFDYERTSFKNAPHPIPYKSTLSLSMKNHFSQDT